MLSPPALLKVSPKLPEAVGVKVSEYVVHGEPLASGSSRSVAVPKLTACELYYRGLLLFRLGDGGAAAISHTRAAEAGNADAMFELSVLYARGLGVRANADLSEAWLQRAAAANHPRALYNVGAAYASGAKGQPDYERAASYYERATYLGNGRAAATLAAMISAGEIPGTADEASAWLTMAEDLGFFPEARRSREHAS